MRNFQFWRHQALRFASQIGMRHGVLLRQALTQHLTEFSLDGDKGAPNPEGAPASMASLRSDHSGSEATKDKQLSFADASHICDCQSYRVKAEVGMRITSTGLILIGQDQNGAYGISQSISSITLSLFSKTVLTISWKRIGKEALSSSVAFSPMALNSICIGLTTFLGW